MAQNQNELTGIERQLVLQYLVDGNVPVTVTEEPDLTAAPVDNSENKVKKAAMGVFPVALMAEQLTVLDQGIILLQNPPESVKSFDGKMVRVQFYFNKLGLYFITRMKSVKSGLALAVPGVIKKIVETEKKKTGDFTALICFNNEQNQNSIKCRFDEEYPLFVSPKWSDVEENDQVQAKTYLENFVMKCRSNGKAIGNGLHLISLCRYLAHEKEAVSQSIEGRKNPPAVIYIDEQRIVFACRKEDMFLEENHEYAFVLGFPLPAGPIKERTVYTTITVENVFNDSFDEKSCAVCLYKSIKEEDARYLEDKKN